jgi:hypothetical protein
MRGGWLALLLIIALSACVAVAEPVRRVSAEELAEGLLARDPALRDRAELQLKEITPQAAERLARHMQSMETRDTRRLLGAVSRAGSEQALTVAMAALDHDDLELRRACLNVLCAAAPAAAGSAADTMWNARRAEVILTLVTHHGYVADLCQGLDQDAQGASLLPLEHVTHLATLMDRRFGTAGFSALIREFARLMLDAEAETEEVDREAAERRRRAAAGLLQAVWIVDPASQWGYGATLPLAEREKSVQGLLRRMRELETQEFVMGEQRRTGARYGDYLLELLQSDLLDVRAPAALRLRWWRGDDVPLTGEDAARAMAAFNDMNRREAANLRRELRLWWHDFRQRTEAR